MASQAVRALIVFAALRSSQRAQSVVLALAALSAFIACASIHLRAQADIVAVSTHTDFAARDREDQELDSTAPERRRVQQNHDVPAPRELNALEPEDSEVDAGLDAAAVSLSIGCAPLLPLANLLLFVASVTWMARFSLCCALPRGPPDTRR